MTATDAVWCPSCKQPEAVRLGERVVCACGHNGGVLRQLRQ